MVRNAILKFKMVQLQQMRSHQNFELIKSFGNGLESDVQMVKSDTKRLLAESRQAKGKVSLVHSRHDPAIGWQSNNLTVPV